MIGFTAILLLAAACWLVRVTFIVFVPAERLPSRVTAALGQVAPATLAALVSVQVVGVVQYGAPPARLASLGCVAAIAAVAHRRPSLTISAGLGVAAVLLIDLVLTH